jgi:GntR family transcriptional repressor for pyruvate dehydrogenase complex
MYEPIHSPRLYEQIVQQIEERILKGDLKPGEKLPSEHELAEQFGVSRTAIREATKTLRTKGLVEVQLGRGTFVSDDTSQHLRTPLDQVFKTKQEGRIQNLVEIREIIETRIAALAAERADQNDINDMQSAIDAMEKALDQVEAFVEADLGFHHALAKSTKNPLVTQIFSAIVDMLSEQITHTFQTCDDIEQKLQLHKQILESIVNRDPQAASEAMHTQLEAIRQCDG